MKTLPLQSIVTRSDEVLDQLTPYADTLGLLYRRALDENFVKPVLYLALHKDQARSFIFEAAELEQKLLGEFPDLATVFEKMKQPVQEHFMWLAIERDGIGLVFMLVPIGVFDEKLDIDEALRARLRNP